MQAINGAAAIAPAGVEYTEGMEGRSIVRSAETAAGALAAHAQATMQARIFLARTNPRDWDRIRVLVLKECKRDGFARAARYAKPVGGKKIPGWSIRFAEAAFRILGNCMQETVIVFDSDKVRGLEVRLVDLESNNSIAYPILLDKTVERSDPRGQAPLDIRINSEGREVYLIRASEDDLQNKQNAAVSKARRNAILGLMPADLLEDCLFEVTRTLERAHAQDPDGFKKQVIDGFASLRIMPDALRNYLGHPIEESSAAEIEDLRGIYQAIKEGETSWAQVVAMQEERGASAPQERPSEPASTTPKPSRAESMAAQMRARTAPKE